MKTTTYCIHNDNIPKKQRDIERNLNFLKESYFHAVYQISIKNCCEGSRKNSHNKGPAGVVSRALRRLEDVSH